MDRSPARGPGRPSYSHIEPPTEPARWPTLLALAEQHRLTAYDAACPELAGRIHLPLATFDGDLRKAALAAGVLLVET